MTGRVLKKSIMVGNVQIGGGAPISVQSMCSTKTEDIGATLTQINELYEAGCELVRLAVLDKEAASALKKICAASPIPVVADIHFDPKLALLAVLNGVSKVRINPGNISDRAALKELACECERAGIPIRIGINGGSLPKGILEKYSRPTAEGMVEAARGHVRILNDFGFDDICLSLKSSSVPLCIKANRLASKEFNYPLHLGVTESGTLKKGLMRSAIGIGVLLNEGIGDTIRVSLTEHPIHEVEAAKEILSALDIRRSGVRLVSCPTCGRTQIDLIGLAHEVEERLAHIKEPLTVAVMGCVVNGPGEAREADYGIAGGKGVGVVFKKGEKLKTLPMSELADELVKMIERDLDEKRAH